MSRLPRARVAACLLLAAFVPVALAANAFAALQRLTGDWQASVGTTGRIIRLNFRAISNGSAFVETFASPSGRETLTIFHPDGSRLLATHYCAQGNQPRLALDPDSPTNKLTFRFIDATNLRSQDDSHLVRLTLDITGDDRFDMTEVYAERGKEGATTYHFTRVK